jgi:preprotein translocase subunit SecA
LDVVETPPTRQDKEILFIKQPVKINVVIEDVTQLSKAGRPVLIGTLSVEIELLPYV